MLYKSATRKPIQQEIQLIQEVAGYYHITDNDLESLTPLCLKKLSAIANRQMRVKGENDHPYHKYGIWTIQDTIQEYIEISKIGTSFSHSQMSF